MKKLCILMLGLTMLFGISTMALADAGDKGVSYKGYTTYSIGPGVNHEGELVEDIYVLRHGTDEDWEAIEKLYYRGYLIMEQYIWTPTGVYVRGIAYVGFMPIMTPWVDSDNWVSLIPYEVELPTADQSMTIHYGEFYVDFEDYKLKVKWNKTFMMGGMPEATLGYVDGLIWDMSNADYIEGQQGR